MADRTEYEAGYQSYGQPLGVLLLDNDLPRPPGDIGNAQSFDHPVQYRTVEGAVDTRIVRDQDPELLDPFVETANELLEYGVVAITTSCGFLLMFQEELSARVPEVPVYTSSLLQIPVVKSMLAPDQQIGIISADETNLQRIDHPVLTENEDRLVYEGVAKSEDFQKTIVEQEYRVLDTDVIRKDVVDAARRVTADENVGAIIFECVNLRPYIDDVQEETGLPVFDYLTLSDMAYGAAKGTRY
jgi:hypothetical protein